MRIFTFGTGILLIVAAVWCFLKQGVAFVSAALVSGLAILLLAGCLAAMAVRQLKKNDPAAFWTLAEALLDGLTGLLVVLNALRFDSAVPSFLGMWLLACAVLHLVPLLFSGKKGPEMYWLLGLCGLTLAAGIFCTVGPSRMSSVFLMGMVLVVQAANLVAAGTVLAPGKKMTQRLEEYRRRKSEEAERGESHDE